MKKYKPPSEVDGTAVCAGEPIQDDQDASSHLMFLYPDDDGEDTRVWEFNSRTGEVRQIQ